MLHIQYILLSCHGVKSFMKQIEDMLFSKGLPSFLSVQDRDSLKFVLA